MKINDFSARKASITTALLSFCIGTGLMIFYYFDMSIVTVLYSFYIVLALAVLNIILLLFLLFKGIQGIIIKDTVKRSAIILSANIPVEWTKSLKVIVCGVMDGKITENGEGYTEFDNFAKAKEVFPQLNIYQQSKTFTKGLGNKITEILRFETWKAYDRYSS